MEMDDSVPEYSRPLTTSSQTTVAKALRTIQQLMDGKKTNLEKDGKGHEKATRRKHRVNGFSTRGVVYLKHIPHGFYEDAMNRYFKQFGLVTRLIVVRSKKTGRSKGYAFVEFRFREVAKVVAATMNNYLMFGRLIKAEYIPAKDLKYNVFRNKKMRPGRCPGVKKQKRAIFKINREIPEDKATKFAEEQLKRLSKFQMLMETEGIDFDCQVCDIPSSTADTSNMPVLEIDESDDEIEFRAQPGVKTVIKNKKHSKKRRSIENTPKKKDQELQSPKSQELRSPKSLKRSLSSGSNPERKRITLLQTVKPKHELKESKLPDIKFDRNIAAKKENPPQKKKILLPCHKKGLLVKTSKKEKKSTPKTIEDIPQKLSTDISVKKSLTNGSSLPIPKSTQIKKSPANDQSALSLKKLKNPPVSSAKPLKETPVGHKIKIEDIPQKLSTDISLKKNLTNRSGLPNLKSTQIKKSSENDQSILSLKKLKDTPISSAKPLKETPVGYKIKMKKPKSEQTTKKTPLFVQKNLVLRHSEKKSNIPRLKNLVKLKSPK